MTGYVVQYAETVGASSQWVDQPERIVFASRERAELAIVEMGETVGDGYRVIEVDEAPEAGTR